MRLRLASFPVFVLASILSQFTAAQSVQSVDASQVVANAKNRLGFSGSWFGLHATGTLRNSVNNTSTAFDLYMVSPSTYRLEVHDATNSTVVVNGDEGYRSANGQSKRLSYNEVFGRRCPYIPVFSHLTDPALQIASAPDSSDSTKARIRFRRTDTDAPEIAPYFDTYIYFDPVSSLPVRLHTRIMAASTPQIGVEADYSYSDYRSEGPYMLPHQVTILFDQQPHAVLTFDKFAFGTQDASLFNLN